MLTNDKLLLAESKRISRQEKTTPKKSTLTTDEILSRLNDEQRAKIRVRISDVLDPTRRQAEGCGSVDN